MATDPDRGALARPGPAPRPQRAGRARRRPRGVGGRRVRGQGGRRGSRTDPGRRRHRHRHRRRDQPAGAVRPDAREGPGPRLAAAHPDEHAERPGGVRRSRDRCAGRRAHDGQRVRVRRRSRCARARPDPPRPRGRRRGRRHRGVHPPAQHRRLRADARDVDAQRRAAARVPSVGQGPRRFRARRGRRRARPGEGSRRRSPGPRAVRRAGLGRADVRRVRHRAAGPVRPGAGDDDARRSAPESTSTTSCT